MFSGPDIKAGTYGEAGGKTYDDLHDVKEVVDIIKASPARVVDNIALAQDPSRVKTAIIPGPMIYGLGQGPVNIRSIQGPEMAKYAIQNGRSFTVGKGESAWSNVHVRDMGSLFALLFKAASEGKGSWNEQGIYLPENGIMVSTSWFPAKEANDDPELWRHCKTHSRDCEITRTDRDGGGETSFCGRSEQGDGSWGSLTRHQCKTQVNSHQAGVGLGAFPSCCWR